MKSITISKTTKLIMIYFLFVIGYFFAGLTTKNIENPIFARDYKQVYTDVLLQSPSLSSNIKAKSMTTYKKKEDGSIEVYTTYDLERKEAKK